MDVDMDVEKRHVDEIEPYENNPRENEDAVAAVADSIEEFGFRQPIVVDEDGTINLVTYAAWLNPSWSACLTPLPSERLSGPTGFIASATALAIASGTGSESTWSATSPGSWRCAA